MLAVVPSFFGLVVDLDAASSGPQSKQIASATLHVSVKVMPVVQAASMAAPLTQNGPVTYRLETAPRQQTYEVHTLPPDTAAWHNVQYPAILKTLVVVPQ
jgi:hypothetical protein